MLIDWRVELSREGHKIMFSGVPSAMHCHHYNINLQKMLEDTLGDRGVDLMYSTAEAVAHDGFQSILNNYPHIKTTKSKLEFSSAIYQNCGLGIILFQKVGNRSGRVVSPSSHHVTGWLAKHGRRDTPGCHFARGWIAGVIEVIYGLPRGACVVQERICKMMRNEECLFVFRINEWPLTRTK